MGSGLGGGRIPTGVVEPRLEGRTGLVAHWQEVVRQGVGVCLLLVERDKGKRGGREGCETEVRRCSPMRNDGTVSRKNVGGEVPAWLGQSEWPR